MGGQRSAGAVGDCGDKVLTIVAGAVAVDVEVDAGLEDGVAAGVAVDTDPRGRGVRTGAAGGLLRGRDGEGAGHGLVGSLMRDKSWQISGPLLPKRGRQHTVLATRTAPAQLLLYSTCETLPRAPSTAGPEEMNCFGCDWWARPEARRAARWAKRSLEVGIANAAVARSTWQRSVAANMASGKEGERGSRLGGVGRTGCVPG